MLHLFCICSYSSATTSSATTSTTSVSSAMLLEMVSGSLRLLVTVLSGAPDDAFVDDVGVNTGVQNGIAEQLEVPTNWVSATLAVDTEGRRPTTSTRLGNPTFSVKDFGSVQMDFVIAVPNSDVQAQQLPRLAAALGSMDDAAIASWGVLLSKHVAIETRRMDYIFEVLPDETPDSAADSSDGSANVGLIIGSAIASGCVVCLVTLAVCFIRIFWTRVGSCAKSYGPEVHDTVCFPAAGEYVENHRQQDTIGPSVTKEPSSFSIHERFEV
jgi:hypothetical protein